MGHAYAKSGVQSPLNRSFRESFTSRKARKSLSKEEPSSSSFTSRNPSMEQKDSNEFENEKEIVETAESTKPSNSKRGSIIPIKKRNSEMMDMMEIRSASIDEGNREAVAEEEPPPEMTQEQKEILKTTWKLVELDIEKVGVVIFIR